MGRDTELTVLVVEDDDETREYIAGTLREDESIAEVRTASCYEAAVASVSADPPDVMLVDLGLPDGSGIDLIIHGREFMPDTLAMVITVFGDEASLIGALEAGARGYLLKSEGPSDLRESVAQLVAGGAPISPAIASFLLKRFNATPPSIEKHDQQTTLSPREQQVLELIVKGCSNQDVADALGISRHTSTSHVRSIYRKLEVRSRSEAIYEGLSRGIISVPERS
jgi:DNA-binding NarL/FixJ family response regulator